MNAQSRAEQSINETLGHIETARSHLSQIDGETTKAEQGAAAAQSNIFRLEERLTELKKRYTQNEYDVSKALEEANAADQLAKEADKGAKLLESRFEKADSVLKEKETVSGNVKEQAERLKAKAMKLAEDASVKFSTLRGECLFVSLLLVDCRSFCFVAIASYRLPRSCCSRVAVS